ncbi:hypothetical protein GTU73_08830 [Rathayibacter sp. VKM Ac-2804]|uniref:hypothetical protein n=1 Tax=Rathayibacter sp. VKM Ac-2804 TaxID=2609257 RepID=UPI00132E8950|nr:hypothetical protein [Rathayibacter sp. VKM Ac-2804]QHF24105.1 hypothetical protein GTU73_08830 [Rathayibacter sp. VKM Ac-2804]
MADQTEPEPVHGFATAQQMEDRSQGYIPADHPHLPLALQAAAQAITDHCHWHIAPSRTSVYRPRRSEYVGGTLYLPTTHLTGVVALTSAGRELDVTALTWYDDGAIEAPGLAWPVVVTITHGHALAAVPLVVDLALQIAARALGAPLGQVREQSLAGQIQWTQTAAGVAGGTVLMPHEAAALSSYVPGSLP